jgi:hypothetical protein
MSGHLLRPSSMKDFFGAGSCVDISCSRLRLACERELTIACGVIEHQSGVVRVETSLYALFGTTTTKELNAFGLLVIEGSLFQTHRRSKGILPIARASLRCRAVCCGHLEGYLSVAAP